MGADGWQVKRTLDGLEYFYNADTEEITWEKPDALLTKKERDANKGTWTWIPDAKNLWQPAQVLERNGDMATCKLMNGKTVDVTVGLNNSNLTGGRDQEVLLWPLIPSSLKLIEDDLVMAENVNAGMISYTLRKRYESNELYTWVGAGRSVLVSVNPYKDIPGLYNDDQITLHYKKPPNRPLPPHPFGIAVDSYESMLIDGGNQSILISGESGAGKTVATKHCLKFLASVAGSESNVENKILMANPLLEAFGNAKTIRNNNSSRFGKWIQISFDMSTRSITSAEILNYLLEKSRVVFQQKNERNYHIFYQMCQDGKLTKKYELSAGPKNFAYMNQSGLIKADDVDDAGDLRAVYKAMDELDFSKDEKEWVFRTTAAILHLGNIKFSDKAEKGRVKGSKIKNRDALALAAKFLQVKEKDLERVLCYRSIAVRSERSVIPLDEIAARDGRNSLAKQAYGKLFDYLVERVNESLQGPEGSRFMGILDIFGFEIFENNSFEQLCINFANEKLQQQFNRTTFKEEEALYTKEGIKFEHIQFIDNQKVLDLIEMKPIGILLLLDEECIIPEGSNEKYMNKMQQQHARHPKFHIDVHRKMHNKLSFEIEHYAGLVKYDTTAFMEKNLDKLYQDLYDVCASSKDERTSGLFPDVGRRQHKSLSYKFRGQLNSLMETLYGTESRYIRCVKPNNKQKPDNFDAPLVVEQLRYSGVFEAVQIRKQGFPFRLTHRQFACRYRCINKDHNYRARSDDDEAVCREIMQVAKQDFSDVAIGKTRVLYKAREHKILKLLRNLALENIVPVCQKIIRGGIHRELQRRLDVATAAIKDALDVGNDIKMLDAALKSVKETIGPLYKVFPNAKPVNFDKGTEHRAKLKIWKDLEKIFDRLTQVRNPSKSDQQELEQAVAKASDHLNIPRTKKQDRLYEMARHQVIFFQIQLNREFLDTNGAQFQNLSSFGGLRDPKDFAKKKAIPIGRGKLEQNMTVWAKAKIPGSLTVIEDKALEKIATASHAALLAYAGDKKSTKLSPDDQGAAFLNNGIQHKQLQDELYCQMIKHVTNNPDVQSASRVWDLMAVAANSFVPSEKLANFVLMAFRRSPDDMSQQLTSAYHNTKYGSKADIHLNGASLQSAITTFKGNKERSRYSTMPGR